MFSSKQERKKFYQKEKWLSYVRTGLMAKNGVSLLALRQKIGGGQFAVVLLANDGYLQDVIEEIDTSDLNEASIRFREITIQSGFQIQIN